MRTHMSLNPEFIAKCLKNKILKQCIFEYLHDRTHWSRTTLHIMNKKDIVACINGEIHAVTDTEIPLHIFSEHMALVPENKLRSVFKSKQVHKKRSTHYFLRPMEPNYPPPSIFKGMTICKSESETQNELILNTQASRTYNLRAKEPLGPPPRLPSIFKGMVLCFDERETQQNYFNRLSHSDVVRALILFMDNISRDNIA